MGRAGGVELKVGWGAPWRGLLALSSEGSAEQTAPDRWRRQWECCRRRAGQICSRWSRGGGPAASRREQRRGVPEVQEWRDAPVGDGLRAQQAGAPAAQRPGCQACNSLSEAHFPAAYNCGVGLSWLISAIGEHRGKLLPWPSDNDLNHK